MKRTRHSAELINNNIGEISGTATVINTANTVGILLTPISPAVADIDCDQRVNSADLMDIIRNWGQCAVGTNCHADLNEDNRVGVPNLLTVINHWLP